MRSRRLIPVLALCALACGGEEPSANLGSAQEPAAAAEGAAVAEGAADAEGSEFGAPLDDGLEITPLGVLIAEPSRFEGQTVRTEGRVERVCQAMGCWMELASTEGDAPAVRVPMAGHAFFLPRDSAGRLATIQGRVQLRRLSADERAHLEAEGAEATDSELSIEAAGVVLR